MRDDQGHRIAPEHDALAPYLEDPDGVVTTPPPDYWRVPTTLDPSGVFGGVPFVLDRNLLDLFGGMSWVALTRQEEGGT